MLADRAPKPVPPTSNDLYPVALLAGEHCPRFAGRVLKGIRSGATSPFWLRERLRRAGVRAIHPVVDVTNYVMLELGQPLHAYDLDKLSERIEARFAKPGETLVLLDGKNIDLREDVLVIADARGPVGLAGIMGGQSTAVSAATTSIFLESAFFTPQAIAGRARRYGLHTDASLRFERGVDPTGQARAIERATELLVEICGGQRGPTSVTERAADAPIRAPVRLRRARASALLGIAVPDPRIEELFERLEMRVERETDGWRVTPPAFRFDVTIEEDLIEEIGRMIGYDEIPSTPGTPTARARARDGESRVAESHRRRSRGPRLRGSRDVQFRRRGTRRVGQPARVARVACESDRERHGGLAQLALAGSDRRRTREPESPARSLQAVRDRSAVRGRRRRGPRDRRLAGLAVGSRAPEHWEGQSPDVDFFDVKGDLEALLQSTGRSGEFRFTAATHPALSPGRTASIALDGAPVGWLGALHPNLQKRLDRPQQASGGAIAFALEIGPAFGSRVPAFRSYSKFPSIRRDLAVVVDEKTPVETIENVASKAAGPWLQHVVVFDVYRGGGVDSSRKSIGLGLILQDVSRTLTDADADQTMQNVMANLERKLGAKIRTN